MAETDIRGRFCSCALSPNIILLGTRLKVLLDPQEQFATAARELGRLIQVKEFEADAESQRLLGATMAASSMMIGMVVSWADRWVPVHHFLLLFPAYLSLVFLVECLGSLARRGALTFADLEMDAEARAVSMGVSPLILIRALLKTGFYRHALNLQPQPRPHRWCGRRLKRRVSLLADRANLSPAELEHLYASVASEYLQQLAPKVGEKTQG